MKAYKHSRCLPSSFIAIENLARFRAAIVTSQHSHQREEEHHWLQPTDKKPRRVKMSVTTDMPRSCIPDPASTDRKVECLFLGFLCGHLIGGGDISVHCVSKESSPPCQTRRPRSTASSRWQTNGSEPVLAL